VENTTHSRRTRGPFRTSCFGLALIVALSLPASGATPPLDDPFPSYEAIRGNVEFWKNVWAEWGMGQVAIHHQDVPAIVYEVVDLPGQIRESYTKDQLDLIQELREGWEDRLRDLARRVRSGASLSDGDKAIVLQITTNVGTNALDDAHRRVRSQRGLRERFRRGLEISRRYDAEFRRIFREAGLPEDLAYLPHVESSFQARARSSAGAVGIWQFTRGTGKRYMSITSAIDERLDPVAAAEGAARYLRDAYDELGSWPVALTSYNHGVGGMMRAVVRFGPNYERIFLEYDGRRFGFASKNFYAEFLAAREIAREADRYFPEGLRDEPRFDLDRVELDHRTTPAAIARAYRIGLDDLATLNPGWSSRAVRNGLSLPRDTTVWMPPGTVARFSAAGGLPEVEAIDNQGLYVVRRGDTLSGIAHTHGMTLGELRQLNGIGRRQDSIRTGQKLRVHVSGDPATHVVRRGDTLSGIASRYGMTTNSLRRLNSIPYGSSLIRNPEPHRRHLRRTTRIAASSQSTVASIVDPPRAAAADPLPRNPVAHPRGLAL